MGSLKSIFGSIFQLLLENKHAIRRFMAAVALGIQHAALEEVHDMV